MNSIQEEFKESLKFNLKNKYNCIPLGFKGFAKVYPGIIKGTHTCITGVKDSGKTKFMRYFWIINAIEFVKEVNDIEQLDIKIFVYCLKQSVKAFRAEILSSFLYRDYKIEMTYLDLLSIQEKDNRKMNETVLGYIAKYDDWFEYFDSKVSIYDTKNKPQEIFDTTKRWIEQQGAFEQIGERKEFKYDNPNLFVLNCTDSLRSLVSDNGMNMDTKKCIEKHVINNMNTLKKVYNCAIVDIHDTSIDKERIESDYSGKTNEEKLEPAIDGLGDSKIVGTYYDFILGIHYPWKYKFTSHMDYSVSILQDNYRSIKVVSSIFSSPNLYLGMWFNGASSTFEELPSTTHLKSQLNMENYLKTRRK